MTEPKSPTPRRSTSTTRRRAPAASPTPTPESPAPVQGLELYFLRHADAGDPAAWSGDEADRPLTNKGRRQARRLGAHLADIGFVPDALLTSPKVRAADTATLVGRRIDAVPAVDQRLAGGLEADDLGELIAGLDPSVARVVLVGHDPEFSVLVSWLVGSPISLRKGALARVDLPDRRIGAGMGSLRWLLPPDAVPG